VFHVERDIIAIGEAIASAHDADGADDGGGGSSGGG
jgi:hypothetical protein